MITTIGKAEIGRQLADALGGSLAVGVGNSADADDKDRLDFEIFRATVNVSSFDRNAGTIVLKATLPSEVYGTIGEVGLWTNAMQREGSTMIFSFDSDTEFWTGGEWVTDNARIGRNALSISAGSALIDGIYVDGSTIAPIDEFEFAYHQDVAGGTMEIRLMTEEDDYLTYTFTPSAGYNVERFASSALTKVGMPDLAAVTMAEVVHTGSGVITMDALRLHRNAGEAGGTLISRKRLETPFVKRSDMSMDIEYPLEVKF